MSIDVLYCAILLEQFGGALLPHSPHSGHIVRCVAADGKHVDDLPRTVDAVFFAEFRDIDHLVVSPFAGFILEDMVFQKLAVVLVGGDHEHVEPFRSRAFGHGAYDVVGLVTREHEHGDIQRPDYLRERF